MTTLWRFPGPIQLAAVRAGAQPTLHDPERPIAYLGDLSLWDWPGVEEFGALTVFNAERLDPQPDRFAGWYVVKNTALDAVLYVPDRTCAAAVAAATSVAEAEGMLPAHYAAACLERDQALAAYGAQLDRWIAARAQLADPSQVPGANEPLYMTPAARREAVIGGMERWGA